MVTEELVGFVEVEVLGQQGDEAGDSGGDTLK